MVMRVSGRTLADVEEALKAYEQVVEEAPLTRTSKDTYVGHARQFVRWLGGDFEPGSGSGSGQSTD